MKGRGSNADSPPLNEADGDIHRLIPDEILDVVTPVIKQTADVYTGENRIIETLDSFWIKSEKELYGRNIYSAPGEGHWYEWYRQEDVAWFKLRNGNPEYTMLRSPGSGYSSRFCFVYCNGNANYYYASYSNGVAFGFCT